MMSMSRGVRDDWKPMQTVGPGVREIRIHIGGAHRVLYVATRADAIYVLHAFEKKTRSIPCTGEIEAAAWRRKTQLGSRRPRATSSGISGSRRKSQSTFSSALTG